MEALAEAAHQLQAIREPEDVGCERRALRRRAQSAGVDETLIARAELALTELGTNLLRHAEPGGYLLWRTLPAARGVEIISVDRGPGIADVRRAMAGRSPEDYERWLLQVHHQVERRKTETPFDQLDHHEQRGFEERRLSMGAGLASVQRLATTFDLFTRVGAGTIVLARLEQKPAAPGILAVSGISVPLDPSGCGDAWSVSHDADGATLLVVDGLGHGEKAALAADAACSVFRTGYDGSAEDYMQRANSALRSTRGAAVAWCRIDTQRNLLRFAGFGNVEGRVFRRQSSHGLAPRPGTLGISLNAPVSKLVEMAWEPGATLVLHTDGIRSLFDPQPCRDTAACDPAILAALLHRDCIRRSDDACVLVARDRRTG